MKKRGELKMATAYRFKSRLKGIGPQSGWNRSGEEIKSLMAEGEVEIRTNGKWRTVEYVSDIVIKTV